MVPDKFNMVDMDGIDLIMMQGEEVPGLYDRLVESIAQCRYQCLYNWFFDGILIPPTYVKMEVNEDDEVEINEGVVVTQDDIIHIYTFEHVIIPLDVTEDGIYTPESGVDGYSPVTVNVGSIESLVVVYTKDTITSITATKDQKVVEGVLSGNYAYLYLPEYGQWNISATDGEAVIQNVINVSSDVVNISMIIDSVDNIKSECESTGYIRLSNHSGDGATFNGRYFYRDSNEPIFMLSVTSNGQYNSYGFLTFSPIAPTGTSSSWGNLSLATTYTFNDITVYIYVMSGMWQYSVNSISYTYDDTTGVVLSPAVFITSTSSFLAHENEIKDFIQRLYLLQGG